MPTGLCHRVECAPHVCTDPHLPRSGGLYEAEEKGYCRMDLPGPTTSMGIRTDYSVGPWDYLACAARYPMA
jgi:hypothetical protein